MLNIQKPLFAMKVKIQRTEKAITLEEIWPDKETSKIVKKELAKVNGDFFDLAQRFFECFPQFREVVFNTQLSDDYNI